MTLVGDLLERRLIVGAVTRASTDRAFPDGSSSSTAPYAPPGRMSDFSTLTVSHRRALPALELLALRERVEDVAARCCVQRFFWTSRR